MPTLRRTSATLIATAALVGGAGTAPAVAQDATVTEVTNASAALVQDMSVKKRVITKTVARKSLSRKARNKSIARPMVRSRGWSAAQFACLSRLWTRESNWNHRARNPRSGAFGIPQALPGGKMASAGRDWRTNPKTQIKWGLRYIKGRYGTPCAAWAHARSRGWY